MRFGSLFSGIGGIDLGLERAGMKCAWQVENDDYCNRVLEKHWPNIPRYGDIRELDPNELEPVDLICGGFPCQDLSRAGRRAGIEGSKSGLWTEYLRVLRTLRPEYVFVENVSGLLKRGMGRVLGDLWALGYDAEWQLLPATAVGAPHIRARVFLIAYPLGRRHWPQEEAIFTGRQGAQLRSGWACEPSVCRVDDGIPRRVDRLRALGNAVVPQLAQYIGEQILAFDERARVEELARSHWSRG